MGNTESILAPMAGEESSSLRTVVSIRNAGAGENQNEIIQSNPSPEFLTFARLKLKFYPSPRWGEGKLIKVTNKTEAISRHSERQRKNSAYYCNTSKLKGIYMNNLTETLPSLIQRNIEKQRVAQLKKAYSELSQAYNLAIAENGAPTEWGMGGMYEEKSHYIMANNMRKFLKLSVDCVDMTAEQTRVNCGHDNLYRNNSYQYGKGIRRLVVLSDGTLVDFRTYSGLCNVQYSAIKNVCGVISVDLNGATPPNRNGEDKFEIFITRDRLVPEGIDGASHAFEIACNKSIKDPYPYYGGGSMFACTAWVLYNENMDYLHCDDLSWAGKHSCK